MSSNYSTIQQHEPLRVPAGWGTQEKRFIAQLEETFDDIYRRFGRLRLEDMSDSLQKEFKGVNELGEELATEITARENGINALITKTGVNNLGQNETLFGKISTEITARAEGINVLTTKTGINNLGQNETLFSRLQTDEQSYALTFQKIGASGYTATGITTIGENGITVTNSNIRTKTVMSADGFKIFDTAVTPNKFIGGIISVGANIRMACDTLYDVDCPNFLMDIGSIGSAVSGWTLYGATFRHGQNAIGVIGTTLSSDGVEHFEISSVPKGLYLYSGVRAIIRADGNVQLSSGTNTGSSIVLMPSGGITFTGYRNGHEESVTLSDIIDAITVG